MNENDYRQTMQTAIKDIDELLPQYKKLGEKINAIKSIIRGCSIILGVEIENPEHTWKPRTIIHSGGRKRCQAKTIRQWKKLAFKKLWILLHAKRMSSWTVRF